MGCGQIKFHHIYAEGPTEAPKPKPIKMSELPKETLPDRFMAEFEVNLGKLKPGESRVVKMSSANKFGQITPTGRATPASTGSSQEDATTMSNWRLDRLLQEDSGR